MLLADAPVFLRVPCFFGLEDCSGNMIMLLWRLLLLLLLLMLLPPPLLLSLSLSFRMDIHG